MFKSPATLICCAAIIFFASILSTNEAEKLLALAPCFKSARNLCSSAGVFLQFRGDGLGQLGRLRFRLPSEQ